MNVDLTEQAVCRTVGTALFFPEVGHEEQCADAKAVCAVCPVKDPCLQDALDGYEYGVWGGTTEEERREIRRQCEQEKPNHCRNGHLRTTDNLMDTPTGQRCATCYQNAQIRYQNNQKAIRAQRRNAA